MDPVNSAAEWHIRRAMAEVVKAITNHPALAPEQGALAAEGYLEGRDALLAWAASSPVFQGFFEATKTRFASMTEMELLATAHQEFLFKVGEQLCLELRGGIGSVNPNIALDSQGMPRHCTDLGGYPVYYVTKDGGILSPEAVLENLQLTNDPEDAQWYVVASEVNYEDQDLFCDHTGKRIESAYGDPEEAESPSSGTSE